tara:strand:+ start:6207 stop:6431 length:225 start_codon:yes stop_codon:yes gene_type:complete
MATALRARATCDFQERNYAMRYHVHLTITDDRFVRQEIKVTATVNAPDDLSAAHVICELWPDTSFDIVEVEPAQ